MPPDTLLTQARVHYRPVPLHCLLACHICTCAGLGLPGLESACVPGAILFADSLPFSSIFFAQIRKFHDFKLAMLNQVPPFGKALDLSRPAIRLGTSSSFLFAGAVQHLRSTCPQPTPKF